MLRRGGQELAGARIGMKVRFHRPERQDAAADRGIPLPPVPARRTNVPRWRWIALMMVLVVTMLVGLARLLGEWAGT